MTSFVIVVKPKYIWKSSNTVVRDAFLLRRFFYLSLTHAPIFHRCFRCYGCNGIYDASLEQHDDRDEFCPFWSNQNKLQWQRPHLSCLLRTYDRFKMPPKPPGRVGKWEISQLSCGISPRHLVVDSENPTSSVRLTIWLYKQRRLALNKLVILMSISNAFTHLITLLL